MKLTNKSEIVVKLNIKLKITLTVFEVLMDHTTTLR